MIDVKSRFHSLTPKKAKKKRTLVQSPVYITHNGHYESKGVAAGFWAAC